MGYQKELLLIKPGVKERRIIGEIISRFERRGLDLLALKLIKPNRAYMSTLYIEHKGKPFYEILVSYMTSDVIIALVVGGENAVSVCRGLVGTTDPLNALPGSIRGDYGLGLPDNVIHASETSECAAREIKIFFETPEIVSRQRKSRKEE